MARYAQNSTEDIVKEKSTGAGEDSSLRRNATDILK